ncbi:protein-L-isoaspartate(D-aspartate) O-methyltransferase [Halorussus salinus]|uniref:protein-L-isoaspartate(D-aspartate) O-methyltransferase n=1 Tax=Halorussus salinus TaxID=1364935 RepID=UPI001091CAE8|nr:protein-L-isoaspartate(D-aspartate) O-methyltransferase [Halorussus salinus]
MFGGNDGSDTEEDFGGDGEGTSDSADYAQARERMVERLAAREGFADATLDAMGSVPRHEFVPSSNRDRAYEDRPLPIGSDQTISAPHMVAAMADLLDLDSGESVLEIGTGCGYHAAVTAELVGPANVYSVEYHESLAERTRQRLDRLGYGEISVRVGDGHDGWPEFAPYDAAYLTCAAPEFPTAVVEQVRPEGRLLGPLESGTGRIADGQAGSGRSPRRAGGQRLVFARRRADGSLDYETHGGVRFVPMQDN